MEVDEKTVYYGSTGEAGASRVSQTSASRTSNATPEKWYYRRGWRKLKKYTTGIVLKVSKGYFLIDFVFFSSFYQTSFHK